VKLYTIGFTQKSAEVFFGLLRANKVTQLVDIRIHPSGQLAGFARQNDLPYLLRELSDGCGYAYHPELAPTPETMKEYRAGGDWARYARRFERLMDQRHIPDALNRAEFENNRCCLLCSEATPENCHRRLVAERIAANWQDVEIIHL
jgi:uncharacterized protein (DUF488 family)